MAIPIPTQVPIPSHSQFCHQFPLPLESHGIPIPIENPIPMVISTSDTLAATSVCGWAHATLVCWRTYVFLLLLWSVCVRQICHNWLQKWLGDEKYMIDKHQSALGDYSISNIVSRQ